MFNPYSNPSVIIHNGNLEDYRRTLPKGERYKYELIRTGNFIYQAVDTSYGFTGKMTGDLSILKDSVGDYLLSVQIQIDDKKKSDEFTIMYTIDSKDSINFDELWYKIKFFTNLDYKSIKIFLDFELNEFFKIKSVDGYGYKKRESGINY